MKPDLEFYFDFSSPYGYLTSCVIEDIAARYDRQVSWRPFLMGAGFKLTGSKPLVEKPLVGEYAKHDITRSARLAGIPFQIPTPFPISTAAAGRAFYWLHEQNPELAKQFAKKVYSAYFAEGLNISKPEVAIKVASDLGVDKVLLAETLQQSDIKARFKAATDGAIARGIFGSPFIFVDGEPFWGNDRLPQVEKWLETGGW